MKKANKLIIIILATASLITSCSNETKMKGETKSNEIQEKNTKSEVVDFGNFKYGTWKIDSVAENKVVIDRLVEDTVIQVMNFRKDGIFSSMEVSSRWTKVRDIGSWKVKKDSVFIVTEQGNIAMRYGYEFKDATLTLNGNFQISSNNEKKPTFYLSKYIEPYDERIYGPKKHTTSNSK
ncbi:MAG: hypothetical protein LW688_07820 [Cryomorphaceae bacterium]|nr:hypothetical protein [Cryomorphaceae bacterium]